ncbi:family 43 glycosylhydrolase [Puia dinghuensis]|uniref:SGNH hydrolase-type esterase domain-containing protein n=1 Tax=Puia dinghuensis TaxID=1792502 RepID=A0A8J2XTI1_9BACT|nr:family 43 glycosylhydrolase [Puia dinghuensis]GGB17497.1 hypothetical protein GCM10011511_46610 [Puia dinghuensis]
MRIFILLLFVGIGFRVEAQLIDTEGHTINAHGAGVLAYKGVYYLFGEIKKGATRLVPGQSWEDYRVKAGGVSCYSSHDLKHWKYEGVALAPETRDTGSDLFVDRVIERPKVIYNSRTRQFVLWMHIDKDDYSYARAGVAVSDKPQGPYRYLGSCRPNGQMSRDMTVFQDEDGRAYLVYTSENNNTMQVCLLSSDYLKPTPVYKRILIGQRREAPAVFKQGGRYFLITSLCSGWDPNAARWAVADSMLGEWRQQGNPCVGEDSATTFHSQSTFVLPVGGSAGGQAGAGFLFMADRWNKTDLERSEYLWLPLRVEDGRVMIEDKRERVYRRVDARPLSLVSYSMRLQEGKGRYWSFIRFYNAKDSLLLEYKADGGDYTEAPPRTAFLTVGVGGDGQLPAVDSVQVTVDVGEKAVKHEPLCDVRQYLRPFWKGDTVFNETVLLYAAEGAEASGRLLYRPDRILAVRSYGLDTIYREGVDYSVRGDSIARLPGSAMRFRADSSFDRQRDLAWYNLQSQWVVVTYTHHDKWVGPVPSYAGDRLPRTMAWLRSGRPLVVVAYGMSITRGMDVSGYDGVAPYMPTYVNMFVQGLRQRYPRTPIRLYNAGLPGSTVAWGAQHARPYVCPLRPDVVVVDFGMNDFWRLTPQAFGDSVRTILRKVREGNPGVEFLLLANMGFDPDYVLNSDTSKAFYMGNLAGYAGELRRLEGEGVIGLDMHAISDVLYRRKKAKDCLVNPLHPNDYMARWYAQGMLALLGY